MKSLLTFLLTILLSCTLQQVDNTTTALLNCEKVHITKVEIQNEVVEASSLEEVQSNFNESWSYVRDKVYSETGISLILIGPKIWTTPDPYSVDPNTCTRLQHNDIESGLYDSETEEYINREYSHVVLGRQWGKCAWWGWPNSSFYSIFALESQGESIKWNKWYWGHEYLHMFGVTEHELNTCTYMNTGCCTTNACGSPTIPWDKPLTIYSKEVIEENMSWWCDYDFNFNPTNTRTPHSIIRKKSCD